MLEGNIDGWTVVYRSVQLELEIHCSTTFIVPTPQNKKTDTMCIWKLKINQCKVLLSCTYWQLCENNSGGEEDGGGGDIGIVVIMICW